MWEKYKLGDGTKDRFFDPDFKDEQSSLIWEDDPNQRMLPIYKKVMEWRRPREIIEESGDTKTLPDLWGTDKD